MLYYTMIKFCMAPSIEYKRRILRKTNISKCAYQEVGNVSFSENFAYVLNGWPQPLFHLNRHKKKKMKFS